LSRQYIATVHPKYRGSVADMKDLEKLPNMPEKIAKAFSSLASGKVLSQSDRVNMVNAMKDVVAADNEKQIEREDNALGQLKNIPKLPGDPKVYVTPYAFRPKSDNAPAAESPKVYVNPKTGQKGRMKDGVWTLLN
jgi:hypothetical protein